MIRFRQQPSEILTINSACEAYRQDVETIAAEYGMSDYTDLILALMMQESSGCGPDVLQSSEGAYNKKYPQVPNGITDTSYSIECGIQELKYAMEKAGVSSPTDMDRIRLAFRLIISAQTFTSPTWKRTVSPPGLKKLQRLLPKWPAAKLRGLRTILFMRLRPMGLRRSEIPRTRAEILSSVNHFLLSFKIKGGGKITSLRSIPSK